MAESEILITEDLAIWLNQLACFAAPYGKTTLCYVSGASVSIAEILKLIVGSFVLIHNEQLRSIRDSID